MPRIGPGTTIRLRASITYAFGSADVSRDYEAGPAAFGSAELPQPIWDALIGKAAGDRIDFVAPPSLTLAGFVGHRLYEVARPSEPPPLQPHVTTLRVAQADGTEADMTVLLVEDHRVVVSPNPLAVTPVLRAEIEVVDVAGGIAIDGSQIDPSGTIVIRELRVTGDLGIGSDRPAAKFEIASAWGNWLFLRQLRDVDGGGFHVHNPWGNSDLGQGAPERNRLEIAYRDGAGNDAWGQVVLHGPTGNVGIGTGNPQARLHVVGDLVASQKNFQIDHPLVPAERWLVHSVVEGPEAVVFYRGEAALRDGACVIELPAYFEALTRREGRTVQLTPRLSYTDAEGTGRPPPCSPLAAGDIEDGRFTVVAIDDRNPRQRFWWEVKAVRADVAPLDVEPRKSAD